MAGSALAAVAAAVLASRLGVYGTIVGAGVVSIVATCGGSVFQHFFSRTGEQIREVAAPVRPKGRPAAPPPAADAPRMLRRGPYEGEFGAEFGKSSSGQSSGRLSGQLRGEFGDATTHGTRVRGWKRSVLATAVVFGVAMIGITGYELASGAELGGGKGTTLSSVVRGGGGEKSDAPSDRSPAPDDDGRQSGESERSEDPEAPSPGGVPPEDPDAGKGDGDGPAEPAPDPSTSGSTGGDPDPSPPPAPTPTPTPTATTPSGAQSPGAPTPGG
ncbi:hypothetical protein AB0M39_36280 [Streptomyces sp. NPDC051907]|uniref:hypothetical protein n=1 Tax=Streptomyces sp. NPDC051907 TaxID=3155284 RepID=UPI00341F50B3